MLSHPARSRASIGTSIGTPAHSIRAAAAMNRPRSSAWPSAIVGSATRPRIAGSIAGSRRASASTSAWQ